VQLRIPAGGLTIPLDGRDPAPVTIEVRLDTWQHCLRIAVTNVDAANNAHAELVSLTQPVGRSLLPPGENVFAFAAAAASAELCQFLSMVVAPGGLADPGAQLFHFTTGTTDRDDRGCEPGCLYANAFLGQGDAVDIDVTSEHPAAEKARAERAAARRRPAVRKGRFIDDLAWRLSTRR
jgi:hypothetical protein